MQVWYEALEVMPFGLINAPETYQKAIDKIIDDLQFVRIYPNGIVIFSKTIDKNLDHIGEVLKLNSQFNLKLKITKCDFIKEEITLFGNVAGRDGVMVDEHRIENI